MLRASSHIRSRFIADVYIYISFSNKINAQTFRDFGNRLWKYSHIQYQKPDYKNSRFNDVTSLLNNGIIISLLPKPNLPKNFIISARYINSPYNAPKIYEPFPTGERNGQNFISSKSLKAPGTVTIQPLTKQLWNWGNETCGFKLINIDNPSSD